MRHLPPPSRTKELAGSLLEGLAWSTVLLAVCECILLPRYHGHLGPVSQVWSLYFTFGNGHRVEFNQTVLVVFALVLLPPVIGTICSTAFRTCRFQRLKPFALYAMLMVFGLLADAVGTFFCLIALIAPTTGTSF